MKVLSFLCASMLVLSACSKDDAGVTSTSKKARGATSKASTGSSPRLTPGQPAVSPSAGENAAAGWTLEGEWRVQRADVDMYVFKFYGSEASVRYLSKDNEEFVGSLTLYASNGFVITSEDGIRHLFRYVVEGDQVFIGRGESHVIEDSGKFSFKVTNKHSVYFDGAACSLKNGDKVLQTIECSYDRDAKPPVFTYDSPIPAMPGPKRPRRLFLVGKTLISETLYAYKTSKVE